MKKMLPECQCFIPPKSPLGPLNKNLKGFCGWKLVFNVLVQINDLG